MNLTEQERGALIECAKKLTTGRRSDKVKMAKLAEIALASLTAEPMIWHNGDITDLLAEGNIAAHRTGTHVMPLYPAPPVPVMKPVDLRECRTLWYEHDDLSADVQCIPVRDIKKALREAGIQIEGEE